MIIIIIFPGEASPSRPSRWRICFQCWRSWSPWCWRRTPRGPWNQSAWLIRSAPTLCYAWAMQILVFISQDLYHLYLYIYIYIYIIYIILTAVASKPLDWLLWLKCLSFLASFLHWHKGLPSSNSCSSTLKTSGWAFSTWLKRSVGAVGMELASTPYGQTKKTWSFRSVLSFSIFLDCEIVEGTLSLVITYSSFKIV